MWIAVGDNPRSTDQDKFTPTGLRRFRRASSSTPAGSCGHGTSSRGFAPTAIHMRPRWGRTAAVAGRGHWGGSEPPDCRLQAPRAATRGRGKPGGHWGHKV